MKYNILAKTFNGIKIEPKIDLEVVLGERSDLLPLNVYSTIEKEIKDKLGLDNISFYPISRDLENFKKENIEVDYDQLTKILIELVYDLAKDISYDVKNSQLKRVATLYEDRLFDNAKAILESIEISSLSKRELEEYLLYRFRVEEKKTDELFEELKFNLQNNPIKVKQLYFEYIKYLEDNREERRPIELINEFESRYPLSILSDSEISIYYYLKGRAYYARGEFLLALKYLSRSLKHCDRDEQRLLASIYNTATNSFTDNLFFDEAEQLSTKAYHIRDSLRLPELKETKSLLGGIYFKSAQYKKAYTQYKSIEEDTARYYNYLAKSSLMMGYTNKAYEYIEKSAQFEDKKGFLLYIKFLYLFKKSNFDDMIELFKETILLPEKRKEYDKFVIGWSYTLMAKMKFSINDHESGVEYLYRSVDYFMKDKYILESFYVTLYIYKYSLSDKYILYYYQLTEQLNIKERFKEYVEKHSVIVEKYKEMFDIQDSGKNNLKVFFDDAKDIDIDNYNPEYVNNILSKICLI